MKHTLEQVQAVLSTGQHGRLYVTSKPRETFIIQLLPEGVKAKPNGDPNPCLNRNAVTVFRWRHGETKTAFADSWAFDGKWQIDFENLVNKLLTQKKREEVEAKNREQKQIEMEKQAQHNLLATYK